MNDKYLNIPKEKFELANNTDKIYDVKFDTKPLSYFQDAFIRFCKNKASVIASIIIVLIILFSFLVPIFTSDFKKTKMDIYYSKKSARLLNCRNSELFSGSKTEDLNERQIILELAKGQGAIYDGSESIQNLGSYLDNKYQPVIKIKELKQSQQGVKGYSNIYNVKHDEYLSVGFMYLSIEQSEYYQILDWENETGLRVIYPLIADNDYHFTSDDSKGANFWYKTDSKGNPIKYNSSTGTTTKIVKNINTLDDLYDVTLEDNYMRDSEGNLIDHIYTGGGDYESAQFKVRVLYYNYYVYTNGTEPIYILGTDSQGYDLAYRMAKGIQLSLLLAVCVSIVNFIIGAIYGAIQGYYGGAIDLTMDRISDILSGIPFIVVATLFQMHFADKVGPVVCLIFAFILTGWIGTAARVRTQFYRFKNSEYVMAAKTLGANDTRIIWKHIFPNSLGTIITSSALVIPSVIFSESMLSYLVIVKLGGTKFTSLGTLLSDASSIWTIYPHLMICPAVVISLLMICFNLFGNGLRDAFNPTLRGTEE